MAMFVKIVRVPGSVSEIALNDGATVADALNAAEITASPNEEITINGNPASTDRTLFDGDRLILAKQAKSAR